MCCEDCFECQEPCWQVNIFFGNDPGALVSRADISDTNTTSVSLSEKDIRHSVCEEKPAVSAFPAGPPCYASSWKKDKSAQTRNIHSAGSMLQNEQSIREATLPGEMPGADHKKPWYAVSD